jgi:solute:Na+ symporter, SSS family
VVLGGASTIGSVALGYENGISGMWLVFWIGMGVIALGILMSTRLSRLGVYTVSEMLENRYESASRLISAIIIAVYALMIAITSTIAIGTVFNVVLPLSSSVAILVAGGIVVAYSVAGGMWSITLTDYLQFLIMTVGIFFLLLPLTIAAAGGFSGMSEALPTSYFDLTAIGWQTIFTYFLLFFFGLMIGQDIWQRVFTARSPEIARWGSVAAGVYCLLYALAGALASMAAGSVVVVALMIVDGLFSNLPIIYGMLVSLVVFVVVSLLTPRPSEERMRAWERRLEGPGTPP